MGERGSGRAEERERGGNGPEIHAAVLPPRPDIDGYVPVEEPGSGKLLFRYDPKRDIIEIVRRRITIYVDLRKYQIG